MKNIIYILLASTLFCSDFSERYYKSMDRGIEMFENSETESDYLKTSNLFYRISQVQKTCRFINNGSIGMKYGSISGKSIEKAKSYKCQNPLLKFFRR